MRKLWVATVFAAGLFTIDGGITMRGTMRGGFSATDPFILKDISGNGGNRNTNGRTLDLAPVDPAKKTLILISDGQSNTANVAPTAYIPAHSASISNLNIYDGALYSITGDLIGCGGDSSPQKGNVVAYLAEQFVSNGIFNRVIIVPVAIPTTTIADHSTGALSDRPRVAMARLAARGITPATTGVTFAYIWNQGETDHGLAQATYQASFATIKTNLSAAGFTGRIFVAEETWIAGAADATIQAAQLALVDNTTVWSLGNLDALTGANRQADNTHWSDAGLIAAGNAMYTAMHASGTPF